MPAPIARAGIIYVMRVSQFLTHGIAYVIPYGLLSLHHTGLVVGHGDGVATGKHSYLGRKSFILETSQRRKHHF